MKLTTRLTIATASLAVVLFGAGGGIVLRKVEHNARAAAEREAIILGRSLQVAFKNAMRDRQLEDIGETLDALSQIRPDADIFVYDEEGRLVDSSERATPSPGIMELQRRARSSTSLPLVEFLPEASGELIRIALPLRRETENGASVLVLERPLTRMLRELHATRRSIAILVVGFMFAVALLAFATMRIYVGAPLARLVDGMRRVRNGALPELASRQYRHDELGEAQREFDDLVRQLDAAHQRIQEELDARRRMTRALEAADKLITLGQMSAVLAHEIGSPLQVMEGRARSLVKHAEDAAQTRRSAEILVQQAERITRIVAHMLDMTRRPAAIRRSIEPAAVVRRVLELVEYEARRRRLRVILDVQGSGTVNADPDQLEQIVLNLCRNAFEAAPADSEVRLDVHSDERGLRLDVRDRGSGVPPELRPQLFEPFFTTKAASGGSGLGLSVVKSLAEEHGGQVTFTTSEAEGTVFSVFLPNGAATLGAQRGNPRDGERRSRRVGT